MGYNQENFKRIRAEYEEKSLRAQKEADARREELYRSIPSLRAIDLRLSGFALEVMQSALSGGDAKEAVEKLRAENAKILADREALLRANGFPADYTRPHYDCDKCQDSGYVGIKMCDCMKRRLREAALESSGLSSLMRTQSFENFSLDYYRSSPAHFDQMKKNLSDIRDYANAFGTEASGSMPKNLLLVGGTGLGKTHLSTSLARAVIAKGFDVYYTSAVGMLSDFEDRRFGSSIGQGDGDNTARYTTCDLLILDDLGTEVVNQFTLSALYHVLNTRINLGLATVISTNLSSADLRKTYSDRITSRLFGEFFVLPFVGTDVRKQKLE